MCILFGDGLSPLQTEGKPAVKPLCHKAPASIQGADGGFEDFENERLLFPLPTEKNPHRGSSWVWVALVACLLLIVFVLEINTVIFLAAFIKTCLLKSSSALLINFFDAASTPPFFRASFFFIFLTEKAKKAHVDALQYSALESKQAEDALNALST